jgi:YkoY family integral membrane protein
MNFDITSQDLFTIGVLILLEGVLSVDNALVLAVLAKRLPEHQRKKALTYGLAGAFIFRLIALSLVIYLVQWRWIKFVGGGYLLYISISHLFFSGDSTEEDGSHSSKGYASFWKTVVAIELTDIAFALDSILAGVALTKKLWVVFVGGVMGIVLMRLAAAAFINLIAKFPRLEKTAYILVFIIGAKVIIEGLSLPGIDFHSARSPSFWVFWGLMATAITSGFLRRAPATHTEVSKS